MYSLYKKQPSFVLGFHGCDESVGEAVLAGKQSLLPSKNDYDWLGSGIYFWESNPRRALQFAGDAIARSPQTTKGTIRKPFVLGAIIDLGICCNLHDIEALEEIRTAYDFYVDVVGNINALPKNKGGDDMLQRILDCTIITTMHFLREASELSAYDTVRSFFQEGGSLYPGTRLTQKSHIQIAVRNPDMILGYFRPILKNTTAPASIAAT